MITGGPADKKKKEEIWTTTTDFVGSSFWHTCFRRYEYVALIPYAGIRTTVQGMSTNAAIPSAKAFENTLQIRT